MGNSLCISVFYSHTEVCEPDIIFVSSASTCSRPDVLYLIAIVKDLQHSLENTNNEVLL